MRLKRTMMLAKVSDMNVVDAFDTFLIFENGNDPVELQPVGYCVGASDCAPVATLTSPSRAP